MSSDTHSLSTAVTTRLESFGLKIPGIRVLLPILAIVLSEFALYTGTREISLAGHLGVLLFCLFAPLKLADEGDVLQVLALVPLFRLVNLGMPVFVELTVYWFPLVYGPLIPAAYLLSTVRDDVDLAGNWQTAIRWLPIAIPVSAAIGALEYSIIEPEALVATWSLSDLILISIVMFGFVGFVEEILFRGVLQRAMEAHLGQATGLILASILFGLMHSGYANPLELLFATGIGLFYGIVYDFTDSIVLITVMHGTLNVFLFAVIPLNPGLIPA